MIYIHIPFCHHRCIYCNFFATAAKSLRTGFEDMILSELEQRKDFLQSREVDSVYIGGGTPSLLHPHQLQKILTRIRLHFSLSTETEITLEANPEDMSLENCRYWLDMGINRLSIGVQSFSDSDLTWLGRIHSAAKSREGIENALRSGFQEMSIDLIYGIPGQSPEHWHHNLSIFQSYRIPHLSAYWLTVEPATPLEKLLAKGRKQAPDELKGEKHFRVLMDWAQQAGYEHYEISNLCLPGHYSRHNTAYWNGRPYLGLGPSAHSYRPGYRCWNPSSMTDYADALSKGGTVAGEEHLSDEDCFNEFIMLRLRTSKGCDVGEVEILFGNESAEHCKSNALQWIKQGKIEENGTILRLTQEGKLQADGIASSFFVDERKQASHF